MKRLGMFPIAGASLLLTVAAAAATPAVPADRVAALAAQIRQVAGDSVRVTQHDATVRCALDLLVAVPSAPTAESEKRTFAVTVEAVPYLDDAIQATRLAAAAKRERATWKKVARLVCDGKEFSDHYQDGLCFRPKTAAHERNVAAYRAARQALAAVPRYHLGEELALVIRVEDGEPTDGTCGEPCQALQRRIAALWVEYPGAAR